MNFLSCLKFLYRSFGLLFLYLTSISPNFTLSIGCINVFELAGYFSINFEGLTGLFSSPPPQFGHTLCKMCVTQSTQNVHSKLQIIASWLVFGKGLPQFSQLGLSSSMLCATRWKVMNRKIT